MAVSGKEACTVEEVAEKTKYKPFTVRQACNKGRIKGAYKGRDAPDEAAIADRVFSAIGGI